jgi:signal transduction histidine kinase
VSAERLKLPRLQSPPRRLSYAVRLAITGVMVAFVTIVITFVLLSLSLANLDQYLEGNVAEHRATTAEATADILSQRYRSVGGWTTSTVEAMPNIAELAEGVSIEVVASDGSILYRDPQIRAARDAALEASQRETNDPRLESGGSGSGSGGADGSGSSGSSGPASSGPATGASAGAYGIDGSSAHELPDAKYSLAPIVVDGVRVGTVFVFSFPDAAITRLGVDVRINVYVAVLIAGLIAMTFAALYGVYFSRSFIKPLMHIMAISNRVRAGDLSARTNMESDDELSRLGRAVDEMIAAVDKNKKLEHQLTTDVAHELRTPLMAMQATIEAMMDGVLPMDSARLATLNAEVVRLGRLVDVQLELSRLESGKTTLKMEPLDLSQLVEDLVVSHEMFIEEAGLAITHKIAPGVRVRGDADLLRQAISNLLSNAVRYTSAGGRISVRVSAQGSLAQIFVSDTGAGIAAEDIPHVFERFWRATTSRDRESGGLGVGLAMVKEIAAKHWGIVGAESELGIGSTFILSLPLLKREGVDGEDWTRRHSVAKLRVGLADATRAGRRQDTSKQQRTPDEPDATEGELDDDVT